MRIITFCAMLALSAEALGQDAESVLQGTGIDAGLAVHVGTGDGVLETKLAGHGRLLVHALARDEAALDRARRAIAAEKLAGLATVTLWDGPPRLPYADNLVNLLIADLDTLGTGGPTEAEILRVLTPGRGAAWLRRGGRWAALRKPMTVGMDGWEQYFYDASGNSVSRDVCVQPSTGLQWITGGQETADDNGYRFSEGKVVYKRRLADDSGGIVRLTCRDAFNGLPYWTRNTPGTPGNGPPLMGKLAPLVFSGGRIYTAMNEQDSPLVALDAATGKTLMAYEQAGRTFSPRSPRGQALRFGGDHFGKGDLTFHDGLLIHTAGNELFVVDATTGDRRWQFASPDHLLLQKPRVNAEDGEVYVIGCNKQSRRAWGGGRNPGQRAAGVLAFDLKTGRRKWSLPVDDRHITHVVYDQRTLVVFSAQDNGPEADEWIFGAIDTRAGEFRWRYLDWRDPALWKGQRREPVIRDGKLYLLSHGLSVFDVATGKPLLHYNSGNARCETSKATQNFLLAAFSQFIDCRQDPPKGMRVGLSRGSCGSGFFPAYGLVHYLPTMCNCDNWIRFHMTASSEPVQPPLPDDVRLVRGVAGTVGPSAGGAAWPARDEWPMFLRGPQRDSWSETRLADKFEPAWSSPVEAPPPGDGMLTADWLDTNDYIGPTTAAVVAGQVAIVAVREQHRVEAFDATRGTRKWSFTTGGRIVTPPTLHGGLCLLGCRDGWIYALRADDGRLAWKFLAAPYQRNIVAFSQIESSWPLLGSLLVHDGVLVAVAGYHPLANGGMHVFGLDPLSGELRWHRRLERRPEWADLSQPGQRIDQPDETTAVIGGYQANMVINDLAYGYGPHVRFSGGQPFQAADGMPVAAEEKKRRDLGGGLYKLRPGPMPLLINAFKTAPYRRHYFKEGYGGPYGAGANQMIVYLPGAAEPVHCMAFANSGPDAVILQVGGREGSVLRKYDVHSLSSREAATSDKTPQWSLSLDGPISPDRRGQKLYDYASLVVAGDTVVVAGRLRGIWGNKEPTPTARQVAPGVLRSFDLRTGEPRQTLELDAAPVVSGLSVAYGRIYAACEDGSLRCFK